MKHLSNILASILILAAVCCGVSRAQVAAGTRIDNTAGLRFEYLSGVPDSLHASAETVIVDSLAAPSMRIEKRVSRIEAYAGDTLVYVIRIVNTGTVALTNVTLRDTVDAQSLVLLGASENASCTSFIVTYSKASLGAGEEDSIIVRAGILPLVPAGRIIGNTAFASASSVPQQQASASTRIAERILPFSSMTFTKEASKDSVSTGDTLSYTLIVSSTGTAALTQAAVSDTLPAFFTNASVRSTPPAHAEIANGIMTYRRDTLAAGSMDTIVVTGVAVFAQELFSRAVVNTAYAQAKEVTGVQEAEAVVHTKQPSVALLGVTKSVSASRATAGDSLRYVVRIRNTGNVPLTAVSVRDTVPFQLEDSRLVDSPNASLAGRVVTYARARLEVGQADSVTIASRINADRPNTERIVNTAYAVSDQTPIGIAQAATVIEAKVPSASALRVQKTVSKDRVYIGDTLSYMLKVVNTGSTTLTNVVVCDTIPYQITNVRPGASASVRGNIVTKTIPVLLPGAADTVGVTGTLWMNAFNSEVILNRTFAWTPGGDTLTADAAFEAVTDPTCRLVLRAEPGKIIGNGREKAVIEALLTNTFGIPKPDGTPVYLSTTAGTFSNGRDTMTIYTRSGKAADSLRAVVAGNKIVEAFAIARADDGQGCHSTDTVRIVFYPGAIEGVVRDQRTGVPVKDALVRAFSLTTDSLAGSQVTGADGYYLIPVAKTDSFRVVISITDVFNKPDSVASSLFVIVTGTGNPPLPNKNSVTGTVYYIASGRPVPIQGMPIILTALTNADAMRSARPRTAGMLLDSTVTDSTGAYHFGDIPSGPYEVRLRHKEVTGSLMFVNNGRGECLVNANIAVTLNPNILLKKTGPAHAYVNTTAKYEIAAGNNGTLSTTNTMLIDTLDRLMSFVAASPGGVYDSLGHRIMWSIGRLDSTSSKNFWVTVTFSDTLGATTPAWNRATIYSDQTTPITDSVRTDIIGVPRLRIWKTASAGAAGTGDPLGYTIRIVNTQGAMAYGITVVDSLPKQVRFIGASSVPAPKSLAYDSIGHRVIWTIDSLASVAATHDTLTLTVSAAVRDDLKPGEYSYNNIARAHFEGGPDVYSDLDSLSNAWVTTRVSYLKITKRALRRLIDIGDIAAYAIDVTNISPVSVARSVTVSDRIPFGFRYMSGSTTIGGVKAKDPSGTKVLQWTIADSLGPNQTVQCVYRLVAGAGAAEGDGINTAQAFGRTEAGTPMSSGIASERVEVRRGVFTDHGLIIGKVFYDNDENRYQDTSDTGVKGVELMMEDGTRITTGDDGKFSVPDVNPGEHVIRLRRQSLPPNTEPLTGYSDFAGDALSRFVTVTDAGIARADFYLKRTAPAQVDSTDTYIERARAGEATAQRITNPGDTAFIEDERYASMNLSGVNFAVGKANLQPAAFSILAQAGQMLKEYIDQSMIVAGHTDSMRIHTKEFRDNIALSYARAGEVKRHLIETFNIDSARISAMGFGEKRPIATNKTIEGRALNRRVELLLSGAIEAPKRLTQTVVFTIPLTYKGDLPLSRIVIHDILDDSLHVVEGSGRLNGQPIAPRREGRELFWTIDSVGQQFNGAITYQAQIGRPAKDVQVMRSRSIVTYVACDSTIVCRDTLEVKNRSAVAERGMAVNYVLAGALFDIGKASLRTAGLSALRAVGDELKKDPTAFAMIEGHTDSSPIHTAEFPSNIELSIARAYTVLDHLSKEYGVDRSRLFALGYGSLRPVSSNDDAEGRQANRRVEVRICKKTFLDTKVRDGAADSSAVSTMKFKQLVRQWAKKKVEEKLPVAIETAPRSH